MSGLPILSLITFLPLLGALVIAVLPSDNFNLIRRAALGTALATWFLSLILLAVFARSQPGFQFKEAVDWIPSFGIQYKLGVDGLSVLMVALTTTLSWISILASGPIHDRLKGYMITFLVLEAAHRLLLVECIVGKLVHHVSLFEPEQPGLHALGLKERRRRIQKPYDLLR